MQPPDKIVCLGEVLYELVPQIGGGPLSEVASFTRSAGGAPANVAIAVSKLGGRACFMGKIGNDPFGEYVKSVFEQHAVEAVLVQSQEAKTGVTFISLREDGERDFVFCNEPPADMLLNAAELREDWLEDADFFHYGSRTLIRSNCREATVQAANHSRRLGAVVSFDPNIRLSLWNKAEEARRTVLEHIHLADIVKVNLEELEFLLPQISMIERASIIFDAGVKVLVITLGETGCRVITRNHDVQIPGIKVKAVDTTGAGDSFVGAMLFRLQALGINKAQLEEALSEVQVVTDIFRFANIAGALTATRYGAIPALPSYSEVSALFR